jgi:adenosine deaminase
MRAEHSPPASEPSCAAAGRVGEEQGGYSTLDIFAPTPRRTRRTGIAPVTVKAIQVWFPIANAGYPPIGSKLARTTPSARASRFGRLPKPELHCHLVGAIRVETVIDIHRERGLELPTWDRDEVGRLLQPDPGCASLSQFLAPFRYLRSCLCSPEAIERVIYELIEDQAADGVVYLEVRFAPGDIHLTHGVAYREIFEALAKGAAAGARAHDVDVTLTPGLSRERGPEQADDVLDECLAHADAGVTGFDLFGDEAGHPAHAFAATFRRAAESGLGVTVHAGEAAGAESVQSAVRDLGARRIGHACSAARSPEVLQLLQGEGVFVESCPTSNVQTGAVTGIERHPLGAFIAAGVRCGVFTDDPAVCGTTLTREYSRAVDAIGISRQELSRCVLDAADAAFAPADVRRRLRARLAAGWAPATRSAG